MIPPGEIAVGVLHVVATNLGATDDEVALSVSRLLGFKATSAQLRGVIVQTVERLLAEGRLVRDGMMLVLSSVSPEPPRLGVGVEGTPSGLKPAAERKP